jgi:hypothetical protein
MTDNVNESQPHVFTNEEWAQRAEKSLERSKARRDNAVRLDWASVSLLVVIIIVVALDIYYLTNH